MSTIAKPRNASISGSRSLLTIGRDIVDRRIQKQRFRRRYASMSRLLGLNLGRRPDLGAIVRMTKRTG
jgi:hypothetical protein